MVLDHYGNERWRIRVTNSGPAVATGVQMKLMETNVESVHCPQKIFVDSIIAVTPPNIAIGQSEDFEPIIIRQNGLGVTPISNIDSKRDITINIGEQWRLVYQVYAENSDIIIIVLMICRESDGLVTVEKEAATDGLGWH
jgi:hypothetical protein